MTIPDIVKLVASIVRDIGYSTEYSTIPGGGICVRVPDKRLNISVRDMAVIATYSMPVHGNSSMLEQREYFRTDLAHPDSIGIICDRIKEFKHPVYK